MLTLTPGHQNDFIDCQKAKVRIAVLPNMDVNRWYNSTLELLERGHRLQEFTSEWLNNPKYGVNLPLFTTQAESTIIEFIMEPLWPFRYWTLKNLKWHMVTPLHIITVYNDMFNYMDGIMQALAKENNEWKED